MSYDYYTNVSKVTFIRIDFRDSTGVYSVVKQSCDMCTQLGITPGLVTVCFNGVVLESAIESCNPKS